MNPLAKARGVYLDPQNGGYIDIQPDLACLRTGAEGDNQFPTGLCLSPYQGRKLQVERAAQEVSFVPTLSWVQSGEGKGETVVSTPHA